MAFSWISGPYSQRAIGRYLHQFACTRVRPIRQIALLLFFHAARRRSAARIIHDVDPLPLFQQALRMAKLDRVMALDALIN